MTPEHLAEIGARIAADPMINDDDADFHAYSDRQALYEEVHRLGMLIDMARPVLEHVSRGRRAAFIEPYPDATARMALGAM